MTVTGVYYDCWIVLLKLLCTVSLRKLDEVGLKSLVF